MKDTDTKILKREGTHLKMSIQQLFPQIIENPTPLPQKILIDIE